MKITAQDRSKLLEILESLPSAWLPGGGTVYPCVMTPAQRDILVAALKDAGRLDWLDKKEGGIEHDGYDGPRWAFFRAPGETARQVIDRGISEDHHVKGRL